MSSRTFSVLLTLFLVCYVTRSAVAELVADSFSGTEIIAEECVSPDVDSAIGEAPCYHSDGISVNFICGPAHSFCWFDLCIRKIDWDFFSRHLNREYSHSGGENIFLHAFGLQPRDFFTVSTSVPLLHISRKSFNRKIEVLSPFEAVVNKFKINSYWFSRNDIPHYLCSSGGNTCSLAENLIISGQLGKGFGGLSLCDSSLHQSLALFGRGSHFGKLIFDKLDVNDRRYSYDHRASSNNPIRNGNAAGQSVQLIAEFIASVIFLFAAIIMALFAINYSPSLRLGFGIDARAIPRIWRIIFALVFLGGGIFLAWHGAHVWVGDNNWTIHDGTSNGKNSQIIDT